MRKQLEVGLFDDLTGFDITDFDICDSLIYFMMAGCWAGGFSHSSMKRPDKLDDLQAGASSVRNTIAS